MSAGHLLETVDQTIKELADARSSLFRASREIGEVSPRIDQDIRVAFNEVDEILRQLSQARHGLEGIRL